MVRDKVRIRFKKTGNLRMISHHDLMRCFERMLRRATLPFHSTEGFNPKPRLIFALPLPLGIVSLQEVVELELDLVVAPEEIHRRLAEQAPLGLEILTVERIDAGVKGHVRTVCYRVAVPRERCDNLEEAIAGLMAASASWVERQRPRQRRIDVRPYLNDLRLLPGALEMELLVTPNGTARPGEILELLDLGDVVQAGAIFERTSLELEDENTVPATLPGNCSQLKGSL